MRAGYRVAVCEQIENPKFAKGIVKREVIEVVTPGVAFSDKLLDHKKNNYLMAVCLKDEIAGISFSDVSTGEFFAYEVSASLVQQQLEMISPSELLVQKRDKDQLTLLVNKINQTIRVTKVDDWIFNYEYAKELLVMQFKTVSLKGFGIDSFYAGIIASGAILSYLQETQKENLSHLSKVAVYNPSEYMALDFSTKRNLEITFSMQDGGREGSLISILDKTETAMGARLLKKWITAPLRKLDLILKRQDSVDELVKKKPLRKNLLIELKEIGDLERLISKVCTGRANPREIVAIKTSLQKIPQIKTYLNEAHVKTLFLISEGLMSLDRLVDKIQNSIMDSPPLNIADGGIIKKGFSLELDELRDISLNGKGWIANLQKSERERTGIPSLKVNFNKVFGYYIEVSHANKEKIPADYIRKQTLVNAERFLTPELKTFEEKILNAEEKIYELESQLFNEVRLTVASEAEMIQQNARLIATLDCFVSFAECAEQYNYVKPVLSDDTRLVIIDGRHPVVERILPPGEKFTGK